MCGGVWQYRVENIFFGVPAMSEIRGWQMGMVAVVVGAMMVVFRKVFDRPRIVNKSPENQPNATERALSD